MKISIPLKDIMIAPGKRFDPAEYTEQDVIARIKKLYGVIAEVKEENKYLRVILLPDGETVHNAFFDRNFKERGKDED